MPDRNVNAIIGTRIKIARTNKNLEQGDLAKMVFLTQSQISKIENGNVIVSAQVVFAIAQALEVSESFLNPYRTSLELSVNKFPWEK